MSEFHESIKSLLADIEKFVLETLKNEKLGKSSKNHKQEIIDRITKLKEDYPQLGAINTTEQVKPVKDLSKDDESTRTGGSSNADDGEDPYADSSADIPNVSAAELTDFIKNGYLEKKRPGIGFKAMQKRWCVIKGNIFYYYTDKTAKKFSGAFRLLDYSFENAPEMVKDEKKKELCFKLVRPANRTYEFMALSKSDLEEWKNAVQKATLVVPTKMEEEEDDGDIYEPIGGDDQEPGDVYDDGEPGDIYEEEPTVPSGKPAVVNSQPPEPELIQDDVYDDGTSAPIQEEEYEDCSSALSSPPPPPPVPPPMQKTGRRPPPPPVPDEDPYQGRPLPPIRDPPKKEEEPVLPPPPPAVQEEPIKYRNDEDFENMYIGKWDCTADNDKELSFKKGEIIYIINRDFDEKSWWVGELDGRFGLVPKNYLTEAYETLTF